MDHPTLLSIGLDLPHEQSTPVTSDMLSPVLRIVRRKLLYERCVHLPDYYQLDKTESRAFKLFLFGYILHIINPFKHSCMYVLGFCIILFMNNIRYKRARDTFESHPIGILLCGFYMTFCTFLDINIMLTVLAYCE